MGICWCYCEYSLERLQNRPVLSYDKFKGRHWYTKTFRIKRKTNHEAIPKHKGNAQNMQVNSMMPYT